MRNLQLPSPLLLLPLLLLAFTTTTTTSATPTCTPALKTNTATLTASKGASGLGIRLLQQLGREKNTLVSPYSVWMALTLVYLGAEGQTEVELRQVLGFEGKTGVLSLLEEFEGSIIKKTQQDPRISFDSANRVYYDKKFSIKQCREELVNYLVPVSIVDQPTQAASTINKFVNTTTRGLIPEVIKPSLLTSLTRMVVINAVYFKGAWTYTFPAYLTAPAPFFPEGGKSVTVETMELDEAPVRIGFSNELNARIVQLSYSVGLVKMTIILPEKGSFQTTLASLSADAIWRNLKTLHNNRIDLHLPKFEIRSEFNEEIKTALQQLGVKDLFDESSVNLSSFNKDLYVKHLIHKTVVKVNEEGTEAASVTWAEGVLRSLTVMQTVRVNRPFVFIIHDSDTIMFAGTYIRP